MADFELDHLHLRSADPDRAGAFYADHLGATLLTRTTVRDLTRVVLQLGGLRLFIEQAPDDAPVRSAGPVRGLDHIGLAVADLDQALARLGRAGVDPVAPVDQVRPGVRVAFVRAPDEVLVELIERRGP